MPTDAAGGSAGTASSSGKALPRGRWLGHPPTEPHLATRKLGRPVEGDRPYVHASPRPDRRLAGRQPRLIAEPVEGGGGAGSPILPTLNSPWEWQPVVTSCVGDSESIQPLINETENCPCIRDGAVVCPAGEG